MPVHDATSEPTPLAAAAASQTWNHTVSGINRWLKVGVSIQGLNAVSSVTYGGVALTQLGAIDDANAVRSELWGLVNPNTGTASVVVTLSVSTLKFHCAASSYTDVHQTVPTGTPATAVGNDTTPAVNVASSGGDLVVDHLAKQNSTEAPSVGAGQTSRYNTVTTGGGVATNVYASGSEEAGGGTVSMSWSYATARRWATVGLALKPLSVPSAAHVLGGKIMHGSILRGGLTG